MLLISEKNRPSLHQHNHRLKPSLVSLAYPTNPIPACISCMTDTTITILITTIAE